MARGPGEGKRGSGATVALPGVQAAGDAGWRALGDRARDWIAQRLFEEAEAGRPALWLPVLFGVGVAVYFAADREPAFSAALAAFMGSVALVAATRRRFVSLGLALALAAAAAGFLAAKTAALRADPSPLARPVKAEISGRVLTVEPRKQGRRRVTVAVERFGSLDDGEGPKRVRAVLGAKPALTAGDRVSLTAYWRPPEGPVRPGGYDFARAAYFQGLGATAFAPSNVKNLGRAVGEGFWSDARAALERLRETLTTRVSTAIGGPEGTVAAALVTGVQGPIPKQTEDELRAAGLSHILSISGLHMALIAGTLFWLVRAALALVPALTLRWPVKQVAAATALAGATFYLALSGAEVATQRSYIMIAIAFFAVLVGRPALAPRNFALAGLIVLAWTPEAMLGPSFQMSFAAVAGLVAWFEARRDRPRGPKPETRGARMRRHVTTAATLALVTTLVAGFATAPFAAYHFHRVTPYAVAGNALSEPLLGLVVMPSVVGGLMFYPFGLDGVWWQAMGLGLKGVLAIARAVASWPGSERNVYAFGETSLVLFALGLAWLCLWRTALRWAGVPVLAAALALAAFPGRPDVVIDASGRSLAARGPEGSLALVNVRPSSFAAKVWLAADGGAPPDTAAASDVRCDSYGCTVPLTGGGVVSLVLDARAFDEDCRDAALVVTRLEAPQACREATAVVDRRTLDATGALELTRDGSSFRAVAARDPAASRPWEGRRAGAAPPDDALRLLFAAKPAAKTEPAEAENPVDPTDAPDEAPQVDDQ